MTFFCNPLKVVMVEMASKSPEETFLEWFSVWYFSDHWKTVNELHSTFVSDVEIYEAGKLASYPPKGSGEVGVVADYDSILAEKLRNMQALSKKLSNSRFIDSNGEFSVWYFSDHWKT